MKGKLGSNNKDVKRSSDLYTKQNYLHYNIKLFSILIVESITTNQNFLLSYWNIFSEGIYWIYTSDILTKYLQKMVKTIFMRITTLRRIKKTIIIGPYKNDVTLSIQKDLLYLKNIVPEIEETWNKLNLSYFKTVKFTKIIFTTRSD